MEIPSKLLEQIAFNTRPMIEEHLLIVLDKSTNEEHLSEPLQINIKQSKIAVTFFTGYNGIFNITSKNNKFFFVNPANEIVMITVPHGAYELESLDLEIRRIKIEEGHITKDFYPFSIKPNFSTLGSIIKITHPNFLFHFTYDHTIRDLLGFNAVILVDEYNLSNNPVDILSFDNIFLECCIAKGMISRGKRSGILHNFPMDVNPGYKYNKKFRGGVQWYMMGSKDITSSICFKLKNENNQIVSFNSQSITFRLSIKEILTMDNYNEMSTFT